MSNGWIKLENSTPDKPEMKSIAKLLGVSRAEAFLSVVRIFIWADVNVADGNVPDMSPDDLDDSAHAIQGTTTALASESVMWVSLKNGGIQFLNWDRLNGTCSKVRTYEAERKRVQRQKKKNVPEIVRDKLGQVPDMSPETSPLILSSLNSNSSLNGNTKTKEDPIKEVLIQALAPEEDNQLYKSDASDLDKLSALEGTISTNLGLYTPEFSQIWDLLPSRMKAAQIKVWGIWPDVIRHVMESHKITYDAAHAHIRQKVRAFSASPRGQRKTFSWTGLSFFKDGHFDDDPESWVVHEEKANGRKQKLGHVNAEANDAADLARLVFESDDKTVIVGNKHG